MSHSNTIKRIIKDLKRFQENPTPELLEEIWSGPCGLCGVFAQCHENLCPLFVEEGVSSRCKLDDVFEPIIAGNKSPNGYTPTIEEVAEIYLNLIKLREELKAI